MQLFPMDLGNYFWIIIFYLIELLSLFLHKSLSVFILATFCRSRPCYLLVS